MDPTQTGYNISDILDKQDENTEDIGYYVGTTSAGSLYPGYGAVPPNYSNVTITSGGTTTSPYTYSSGTSTTWAPTGTTATAGKLTLLGDDADLIVNGKSLNETLQALEEKLNILHPNNELEEEWDELRELGNQYRKLEKELKEKSKMWAALKK